MSRVTTCSALALSMGGVFACADPPPAFDGPRTLGGETISAETLNRGRRVYTSFCASCHGGDGSGRGPAAQGLAAPPRDFRLGSFKVADGDRLPTDAELLEVVRKGRTDAGMPAFPHLTPEDQEAVIHYVKTFSTKWGEGEGKTP